LEPRIKLRQDRKIVPPDVVAENELGAGRKRLEPRLDVSRRELALKRELRAGIRTECGELVEDRFARRRRLDIDAYAGRLPLLGGSRGRRGGKGAALRHGAVGVARVRRV
jgi:hypothetical protein